jgi:hypothetical protein
MMKVKACRNLPLTFSLGPFGAILGLPFITGGDISYCIHLLGYMHIILESNA